MSGRKPVPRRANGPSARQMVARAERQARAVAMRIAGKSSVEIGEALGVTRKTAWKLIVDAMEQRREEIAEAGDTLRAIETERCEEYIASLRPAALGGDPAAHRALLRWHERLAKLQALDLQKEPSEGPQVVVIDSRYPWQREEPPIDGELVEPPALPPVGEGADDEG